jgi:hypothetical protein
MPSNQHRIREGPFAKIGAAAGIVGIVVTLYFSGAFSGSHNVKTKKDGGGGTSGEAKPTTRYVESLQTTLNSRANVGGGANVDGRNYPHGITIDSLAGTEESPNGVAFALPSQFSAFRAIVGVDPNSAPGFGGSMQFKVASGEHDLFKTTISRGSPPCTVNVPLEGASNLELQAYFLSGEPLKVAVGEARVVAQKDFPGMPSGQPCA